LPAVDGLLAFSIAGDFVRVKTLTVRHDSEATGSDGTR
jgi:hypothetical protein